MAEILGLGLTHSPSFIRPRRGRGVVAEADAAD